MKKTLLPDKFLERFKQKKWDAIAKTLERMWHKRDFVAVTSSIPTIAFWQTRVDRNSLRVCWMRKFFLKWWECKNANQTGLKRIVLFNRTVSFLSKFTASRLLRVSCAFQGEWQILMQLKDEKKNVYEKRKTWNACRYGYGSRFAPFHFIFFLKSGSKKKLKKKYKIWIL